MVLDRNESYYAPDSLGLSYPLHVPKDSELATVRSYLQTRAQRQWEQVGKTGRNNSLMSDWFESQDRMAQILEQRDSITGSLTFGAQQNFADQATLAVEMLQSRLCHTVCLNSGTGWDTHDNNAQQHDLYNDLFAGINNLMLALENAGLVEDTVVVVTSEFTRTPKRNGENGKDHWPVGSALIIGSGLGGRVLGGTDDNLDARPIDLSTGDLWESGSPLRFDELFAGILQYIDVDPVEWLPATLPYGGLIR